MTISTTEVIGLDLLLMYDRILTIYEILRHAIGYYDDAVDDALFALNIDNPSDGVV